MNQRVHRRSKHSDDEPEDVRLQRQIDRILARDFIHIHVPKTAGSTLRDMLSTHQTTGHFSALKIKRMISTEEWNKKFTFAFVRNPWDRMVSWFFFHKQFHSPEYRNFKSFKDWVMLRMPSCWGTDWREPEEDNDPLVCSNFLKNAKGDIIVDFIGRFEELQAGLEYICDITKKPIPKFVHVRKSSHESYQSYYNDQMIEIVRKRCKEDIDRFGYEF